jgi:lysophospholipid acyltransferase (LPLAT)-like uncharacterized protein
LNRGKAVKRGPGIIAKLGAELAGAYVWAATHTNRWQWVNRAIAEQVWASGKGAIVVCWHERLILAHVGWTVHKGHQPVKALMSYSKQGDTMTRAMRWVHVGHIRGSSDKPGKRKGAMVAMREMKRYIDGGGAVALMPDGPRGPRHVAQMGALQLARMTGAPIVGLAWSATGLRVLNTWDGLLLPPLFSSAAFVWGGPIYVPRDADDARLQLAREQMEAMLHQIGQDADKVLGVDTTPKRPLPQSTPEQESESEPQDLPNEVEA